MIEELQSKDMKEVDQTRGYEVSQTGTLERQV